MTVMLFSLMAITAPGAVASLLVVDFGGAVAASRPASLCEVRVKEAGPVVDESSDADKRAVRTAGPLEQ